MPFGKRGSRCCCDAVVECSVCNSATTPYQITVAISGASNCGTCTNCTQVNGSFVLTQSGVNSCSWVLCHDFPSTITIGTFPSQSLINSMRLDFTLTEFFGTVFAQFDISYFAGAGCTSTQEGATERYETQTVASTIDCGFNSYGLTLITSGTEVCTLPSTVSVTEV